MSISPPSLRDGGEIDIPREAYKVFYHKVALCSIVACNDEVKRLTEENDRLTKKLKRIKDIGAKHHDDIVCPVCDLPLLTDEEMPYYCATCNVGLPCHTWRREEHAGEPRGLTCMECEDLHCVDCYDSEVEMCINCAK